MTQVTVDEMADYCETYAELCGTAIKEGVSPEGNMLDPSITTGGGEITDIVTLSSLDVPPWIESLIEWTSEPSFYVFMTLLVIGLAIGLSFLVKPN